MAKYNGFKRKWRNSTGNLRSPTSLGELSPGRRPMGDLRGAYRPTGPRGGAARPAGNTITLGPNEFNRLSPASSDMQGYQRHVRHVQQRMALKGLGPLAFRLSPFGRALNALDLLGAGWAEIMPEQEAGEWTFPGSQVLCDDGPPYNGLRTVGRSACAPDPGGVTGLRCGSNFVTLDPDWEGTRKELGFEGMHPSNQCVTWYFGKGVVEGWGPAARLRPVTKVESITLIRAPNTPGPTVVGTRTPYRPAVVTPLPSGFLPTLRPMPSRRPRPTARPLPKPYETPAVTWRSDGGYPGGSPTKTKEPHKQVPPRPNVRERKFRLNLGLAGKLYGSFTEFQDFTDSIADAVEGKRCKSRNPFKAWECIAANWDRIDWEKAVYNLIANQIEDYLIGQVGKVNAKAVAHAAAHGYYRSPVGFQFGNSYWRNIGNLDIQNER